ncbi:HD domain-containing protein [Aspergillus clavatus NRRL 1]|uniref:5'-deoxynucleotidase n=1 Tax=Aspergillus clavatus (strain ATCC 1007 / CBS 513.65 / DSM 816 / NCTC 3887 / NRRL 1 / QM 1276 / 107) TaxID=344612 RepID=A1C6L0_ASPCL|nr:HD family hydrolase, putative [Aspergillus clavatus NRRL 1]EAW14031.1 HD family hydrolase, putative [Aspergillus clavatus NRRL 1]
MGSEAPSDPLWTTQSVLSTLPHPPEENSASPIPFFHLLERLKTTKREGWRRFGINTGESISDHMYRMSIMTMLAPPSLAARLNLPHCTKMALVHDMAESLVGDITPVDKVDKKEKARREAEVMDYIAKNLLGGVPGGMLSAQEILKVFHEYEANETLEAQFVHDVDKMELLLQMVEYERAHGIDLTEFCHVAGRIQLDEVKEWAAAVLKEREAFWKEKTANTNGKA